jgi:hypothetical protein
VRELPAQDIGQSYLMKAKGYGFWPGKDEASADLSILALSVDLWTFKSYHICCCPSPLPLVPVALRNQSNIIIPASRESFKLSVQFLVSASCGERT